MELPDILYPVSGKADLSAAAVAGSAAVRERSWTTAFSDAGGSAGYQGVRRYLYGQHAGACDRGKSGGRSALLLSRAKDNNASCDIGPFIRLFDETFCLDDVRQAEITLAIDGPDGFALRDLNPMNRIGRDVADLVAQTINEHHHYPDGLALFLGTLFAPTVDRDSPGEGFTHKVGDVVRVGSRSLGVLHNRVAHCNLAPAWAFGVTDLMINLSRRGLL